MSLSERLQAINEQINALTRERDAILRTLNPIEDAIKKFVEKLLAEMKSAFGSAHPDSAFAEQLIAGLTSEPSTTIGMHEGGRYDPVWHDTKIAYDWGTKSIEVEKSTNVECPTKFMILNNDDLSWYDELDNPLAIESWADLDKIQDELKVAAIMLHLEC